MTEAPAVHATVLVSDLTDPPTIGEVRSVVGYDRDHDAWRVSMTNRDVCAWVRRFPTQYGVARPAEWKVYNIDTALPAEASK